MTPKWRSAVATDPGRIREQNEDRYYLDDEHGVFAVVDGVGGHAAGELAAEIAIDVLRERLPAPGPISQSLREAIAAANNAIYERARSDAQLRGMACVLTVAVLHESQAIVAHVGDSRLYVVWNGAIHKVTPDHSPVGELEDGGELTEEEAMLHPRRHEVFRDAGSRPRGPDDEDFIDIKEFPLKPDAAILLCSDGLSDVLTSAQINQLIEEYDGDPAGTAQALLDAANEAGGTDNITAVFIAGPEFLGSSSTAMTEARARHAVTRERRATAWFAGRLAFLGYGLILGCLLALVILRTLRFR